MLTKSCWLLVLPLLVSALGCASTNPDVRVRLSGLIPLLFEE
ncbi:hypothetical protein [Archangium sp.]